MEISYYVRFREKGAGNDFIRALQRISGVKDINLFFDEESIQPPAAKQDSHRAADS
ncbi:MAG: hypothetical protein PHR28_09910 [candidate division Zixibacteria bacterium]|nr:hypothetical protein [candidate division Zixibacteria bacterium]